VPFLLVILQLLIIFPRLTVGNLIIYAADVVKYRFDEHLCDANWTASAPGESLAILPCPGEGDDARGFVQMVATERKLEDGSQAERTFQTHPMWEADGWIAGTFSLSRNGVVLESGDRLVGKVGLLEGALEGDVEFRIQYDQNPYDPGGERLLYEEQDDYDERLLDVDLDLSEFSGQSGDFILQVHASGSAAQDWAVWQNFRIINRTTDPTRTFTVTNTPPPTLTPTLTMIQTTTSTSIPTPTPPTIQTSTPTITATVTVTPTVTATPEEIQPPPPVVPPPFDNPCACYESRIIDTHFSGNDGFAVGNLIQNMGLMLLTVVDEKLPGDDGLFTILTPDGEVIRTFGARFTPNDVVAIGDVWGDDSEDEILVGIDEDKRVYVYNSMGSLLETRDIPYTRYDILTVGNVRDDADSAGDEIIFASDEKDEYTIYTRLGGSQTFLLDWNFDGSSVPGIKSDAHSDALTTGNVFNSALDEILFIDQNADNSILYIYDGKGVLLAKTKVRFTKFDALASGDLLGNDYDEVLIAIDEDRAIYILDALDGILKMHHGRVTPVDIFAAGEVEPGKKETIFLAVDDDSKIYVYEQE
jgi:hypothetical protein